MSSTLTVPKIQNQEHKYTKKAYSNLKENVRKKTENSSQKLKLSYPYIFAT